MKEGLIQLKGVQCIDGFYPWNNPYNIDDTMLFIGNNWSRLRIKPYIGYIIKFNLVDGRIDDCHIYDKDGSLLSKSRQREIETEYQNKNLSI